MPEEEMKTYTMSEVESHSTEDNLWMLIDNGVYDLSKFKDEHPGGPEVLLDLAGKEATAAFEDVGHSSDAKEQMKQYKIGVLCEADRKTKKAPQRASCFRLRYLLPVGVALSAILMFKVYKRINK